MGNDIETSNTLEIRVVVEATKFYRNRYNDDRTAEKDPIKTEMNESIKVRVPANFEGGHN